MVEQVPEYCAVILSNTDEVQNYLQQLKKHGHIFLIDIDPEKAIHHPRVSMLKCNTFDEYARIIYKMMFDKRLLHVIFDTADEFCEKIKNKVFDLVNMDREFCYGYGGIYSISNFWNNLPDIINRPSINGLKDLYKGKPCVLVNSGPSLNKHITLLKECQDKVVIFACSTAISALYKNGITPHFLVALDPYPMLKQFILPYCTKDTILLASSVTCHDFVKEYPGPVVYFHTTAGLHIMDTLYKDLEIKYGISTSATVTSAALALVNLMNFDPIIFIGQDMCFDGDAGYAAGIDGVTDNQTIDAVTLDGKPVKTLTAYLELFDYLCGFVPKVKDKEIINCSGGMGITGALVMDFKDVIDKYCVDSIEIQEIQQTTIIDKAKILSDLCLIQKDILSLQKFLKVFRQYINMLVENEVDFEYIKIEIDQFLDRLRDKKCEKHVDMYLSWLWYLMPNAQEESDNLAALDIVEDVFKQFLVVIEKQIGILEHKEIGDEECG